MILYFDKLLQLLIIFFSYIIILFISHPNKFFNFFGFWKIPLNFFCSFKIDSILLITLLINRSIILFLYTILKHVSLLIVVNFLYFCVLLELSYRKIKSFQNYVFPLNYPYPFLRISKIVCMQNYSSFLKKTLGLIDQILLFLLTP